MTYAAVFSEGETRAGPWLVTCDHASNHVPDAVGGGSLGLPAGEMARHIAFDPGALGVSRALGEMLDSPAVWSNFSRLVIDPNRGEHDPTLLMQLYDGTIIPANRGADSAETERRLELCYRPYHGEVARLAARREDSAICAVHSFTPRLKGRAPRPWQIGVLYAYDARLGRRFIDSLRADETLAKEVEAETGTPFCVGDNQPYDGHLPGDSIDRHALKHGRNNILIELRSDIIETEAAQRIWAARLAPHLIRCLADIPD